MRIMNSYAFLALISCLLLYFAALSLTLVKYVFTTVVKSSM